MAYFVEVCLRCCARVAFPNRHTNPAFSPLAFLCQTRQTNPDERLLEKCCFDMTATPSCYCHESAWHVSNDVATSATQLFFLFPYNLTHFLISKLSIFLYFSSLFSTPVFHLSFLPLIAVLLSPHKLLISPPISPIPSSYRIFSSFSSFSGSIPIRGSRSERELPSSCSSTGTDFKI